MMSSGTKSKQPRAAGSQARQSTGATDHTWIYVYGIFPGDIQLNEDLTGVGDPAGRVRIVRCGDVAALVSDVTAGAPLGSPQDLARHKDILDASASAVPVLPMQFGALLPDEQAVNTELLASNHDLFAAALHELEGRVQFVVKGRYPERALLREVLAEQKEAAVLGEEIRHAGPRANDDARIRLGEIIEGAVAAKREQDTHALAERLKGHYEASVLREPRHQRDAVHAALLVKSAEAERLQSAVEDLAREWDGRIELRLLGPMAAYDFVGALESGA